MEREVERLGAELASTRQVSDDDNDGGDVGDGDGDGGDDGGGGDDGDGRHLGAAKDHNFYHDGDGDDERPQL